MFELNSQLPYYKISGEGFELGEQMGKLFKEKIHDAFMHSSFVQKLLSQDEENPSILEDLILQGKKTFPKFMDELYGIAAGADQDIRIIFITNFRHSYDLGCSTTMFVQPDQLLLGHNEDHDFFMAKNSGLIKVELDNHTSFVSHVYPGCIPGPTFWLNSMGIGLSGNAINEKKTKFSGIPKVLCDRAAITAKTTEEVIQVLTKPNVIGGYSYNFFSISDWSMHNLETFCGDHEVTSVRTNYIHTNHYICPKFSYIPFQRGSSTDLRYQSLNSRISTRKGTKENILNLLLHPDVYCVPDMSNIQNPQQKNYYGTTVCTAVFNAQPEKVQLEVIPHNRDLKNCHIFELDHGEINKKDLL